MDYRRELDTTITGFKALPAILQDQSRLMTWLASARTAWVALCLVLLLVPLAVIPLTDAALEKAYRPTARDGLFGLIKSVKASPKLNPRKTQARILIWTLSLGGVILLFAREAGRLPAVPTALRQADNRTIADAAMTLADQPTGDRTLVSTRPETLGLGPQGRYLIDSELGRGAMGIVYLAYDRILDRKIALKELPSHLALDQIRAERFRQEARTLAQISHPGIVQVYDLFDEGSRLFLAMELVEGGDLEGLLQQRGQLPIAEAAQFGALLADALACVHARSIVHRDLKPANILLHRDGKVKITDFGISRQEHAAGMTIEGSILGSPEYMSPEQASGKPVDTRADIYALGVILYRMFTGTLPFTGDVGSVLAQQITKEPTPPKELASHLPEEINTLILALLRKDPAQREVDLLHLAETMNNYIA